MWGMFSQKVRTVLYGIVICVGLDRIALHCTIQHSKMQYITNKYNQTILKAIQHYSTIQYVPSVNTFPTSLAAITVNMRGSTYCISPVASNIITVRDMVIRAIPPVIAAKCKTKLWIFFVNQ